MFCSFNGGPYQVNKVLTPWNTKLRLVSGGIHRCVSVVLNVLVTC